MQAWVGRRMRIACTDGLGVDSASDRGTTALMVAANNGHVDICRFLLDQGADLVPSTRTTDTNDCASSPRGLLFVKWLQGTITEEFRQKMFEDREQGEQAKQQRQERENSIGYCKKGLKQFWRGKRESIETHRQGRIH